MKDWDNFEAKLVPLVENGQITSIVVEDGGNMYAADEVAVSGRVEVLSSACFSNGHLYRIRNRICPITFLRSKGKKY